MKTDLPEIKSALLYMLTRYVPPLRVRTNNDANFEVAGAVETMQGKQKVDGFYFASVMPKPKDIRFYFFPNYTHPAAFAGMSEDLKKCLKGKSCFHIKKLSPEMEAEIEEMIRRGVELYQKDGLI